MSIRKGLNGRRIELKVCGGPGSIAKPAKVNWGVVVLRAFRATVIPPGDIVIQPPGGKTLINFETLYRTEVDAFTRSFRLLGQRVQLRIRPTSYTWVSGDGEQFTTSSPGVAYDSALPMTAYVSHSYEHPSEALHPRVDVTWSATYRVGDGRWLPVPGTVTTSGTAANLEVVEARSVLLGGY
ncbi:hypothetical protein ncot_06115 [Nocardioides sp. JQ2195]|uniref:hypothetical protein n=1 Tax=Nocardioides sp. JQ2195 TaxID=2592334 RepID=UPI00143E39CC|nr:hypothetical protein [Nocardioides sp. JQ2195]QIX26224.1 hypothetical protein ncot_06115 [Nocardioides sp. JQ2195]